MAHFVYTAYAAGHEPETFPSDDELEVGHVLLLKAGRWRIDQIDETGAQSWPGADVSTTVVARALHCTPVE